MIWTSNRSSPTLATVRLIPSTATEPLATNSDSNAAGYITVTRYESPSRAISAIEPVASTCPWTKCPPILASARIDRSRFTAAPGRSDSSVVTRAVSGETSASMVPNSVATTVRHTPLMATLSPSTSSPASSVLTRRRTPPAVGRASAICPTLSISPVNMTFQEDVVTEMPGLVPRNARRIHDGLSQPWQSGLANTSRRNKYLDAIYQPRVPERTMQHWPAFDDQ